MRVGEQDRAAPRSYEGVVHLDGKPGTLTSHDLAKI